MTMPPAPPGPETVQPAPALPPLPPGQKYLILVLSGCVHCHQLICRASDADPWRSLPGEDRRILYREAAVRCEARPGSLPHEAPAADAAAEGAS
jgi:hypothetical protein